MVRISTVLTIMATALFCAGNTVHAGFAYSLEAALTTPGAAAQTSFTTSGGPLTLNLFLVQRDTPGAPTPPGFTLQTANFNIGNVGTMNVTGATAASGAAAPGSPTTFSNFWLLGSPPAGPNDPTFVQVGTMTVNGVVGNSSVFTFQDNNPAPGNIGIALNDGTPIDSANPSPYTSFSVSAVPEPSSLGLLSLTGLAFLRRRRR